MSHDYDETAQFTDEAAKAKAESLDCTIEYSNDLTLQIDYDSKSFAARWYEQIDMLQDIGLLHMAHAEPTFRRSKSGNYHITITLAKPLSAEQRIMLQLLLGSDVKREALCLAALRAGKMENPILLFRPKNAPKDEALDDFLF